MSDEFSLISAGDRPGWIRLLYKRWSAGHALHTAFLLNLMNDHIAEEADGHPEGREQLRRIALHELTSDNVDVVALSLVFLRVVGQPEDLPSIENFLNHDRDLVKRAARACKFALLQLPSMRGDPIQLGNGLTMRFADAGDAAVLADLAARTFHDTYAALNDPRVMAIHMAKSFGVAQQRAELEEREMQTILVEAAGEPAAFAQLRRGTHPACVTGPSPMEVWRFYVDKPWHGRGVAQRMMAAIFDEAKSRGAKTLWLGVWERNARAMGFYRKCGFVHVGEHEFLFGDELQSDLVVSCALDDVRCAG